jgi:hypothetical protein
MSSSGAPTGDGARQGPVVMDALELLGLNRGDDDDDVRDADLDGDGDEEVLACNNTGTDEDRAFDRIVGVIEEVMASDDVQAVLRSPVDGLPPLEELNEHERYLVYKRYMERLEATVDHGVVTALPDYTLHQIADVLKEREQELSPEVFDLVTGASLSYQEFEALWKARDAHCTSGAQ